jgi:hypothetical protein
MTASPRPRLTPRQQKTLEILRRIEPRERPTMQREYRCDCRTCGPAASRTLVSVDGTRSWLLCHAGHATWVEYGAPERTL